MREVVTRSKSKLKPVGSRSVRKPLFSRDPMARLTVGYRTASHRPVASRTPTLSIMTAIGPKRHAVLHGKYPLGSSNRSNWRQCLISILFCGKLPRKGA